MKTKLVLAVAAFLFTNILFGQTGIEKLSVPELQKAISENLKNGKKEYDDIFGMFDIHTNAVTLSETKKQEMLGKLKMLTSVTDAKFDAASQSLQVSNRPQISKLMIEQVKNVISSYGVEINSYSEFLYRLKK